MKLKEFSSIGDSLMISAPSWPLQNTVAVNPFWFLKQNSFHDMASELSFIFNTSLYMPLSYYQGAFESGMITAEALLEAILKNTANFTDLPQSIEAFMIAAKQAPLCQSKQVTLSRLFSSENEIDLQVINDFGKYAAAYLDEKQAIAIFPWNALPFWNAWLQAQTLDRSMEYNGLKNFKQSVERLAVLSAEDGIHFMLKEFGILSEHSATTYMQSLVASVLGWSSQFKYVEWQKNLGYQVSSKATPFDLLAVRMAYDYGVFRDQGRAGKELKSCWDDNLEKSQVAKDSAKDLLKYISTLQLALEITYQKSIAQQLNQSHVLDQNIPKAQVMFCIDVRSEMIRRNIEDTNPGIRTIGFAGFFGIPISYKMLSETQPSYRLPVLLSPALEVEQLVSSNGNDSSHGNTIALALMQVSSYFRNLRKNPLSSFLYVELFGALYVEKALRRTFTSLVEKLRGKRLPARFNPHRFGSGLYSITHHNGTRIDLSEQIDRAEAALRHMGLSDSFAKLILILGHGSVTTNNAFGSSLDCGACGGHAGDINARVIVDLLNDSEIRKGLQKKGIEIPGSTQFIAGVHETVSDEIYILESDKVRSDLREELLALMKDLDQASAKTAEERFKSKSEAIDPHVEARSKNWSEVRPEWGLAGNASFIVAPRHRTMGLNLAGRSFLHDYDWRLDETQSYKTLELIMTAPMIVTNWINLQYFASTVAPEVFGSGNKVLHNLVNETGVYEGNGGDLRVGLPIQSVHNGKKYVHDPLRLSVFIEAPREQIELLISKHQVVRELIENEWLHLIHIDPKSLKTERRTRGGGYTSV